MRVVAVLRRHPEESPNAARDRSLACLAQGWTVDLSESWPQANPGDSVAVLWGPEGAEPPTEEAWLVDTRPQWDGLAAGVESAGRAAGGDEPTRPLPGIKQVSFLRRVPTLDHAGFVAAWERHAGLARRHHPVLWRYTQNMVVRPLTPTTPELDGIAELTMRLRQDFVDRMYDSPEGRRIIGEDVRGFIDVPGGWRLHAREYRPR